jgi:tetratricopeptide (TPR) repeat protein
MGRSFQRLAPAGMAEDFTRNNTYYHEASDQHFTMYQRDGRFYQRRHQTGPDGRETNVVEMEIDFVLGSCDHARTYLHQAADGQLVELPIGWYNDKGGEWAMNPGYDRADHMDFRRKLDRECFFCHNAYPRTASQTDDTAGPELLLPGAIPEGIDCQRCHGPGRAHVQRATAGRPAAEIRSAIVNPARLTPERQNEVCFQCHLESTSRRLPYAVRRYDRGAFSYRPGEPLANYILHFDYAPGAGNDDRFEIDHAAYRMLKSACYRKSNGNLTCTTCHNPHEEARGEEAVRRYTRACLNCHGAAEVAARVAGHPSYSSESSCVECHMVKRRTDDVVHAVMTDHYIQRLPSKHDVSVPLRETHDTDRTAYRGEVAPLYPPSLPAGADTDLYLAVAQVTDGANFEAGIPRLRKAIETWRPAQAEFYFEMANAYWKTGQARMALPYYEEALRRQPRYPAARRNYAQALIDVGRLTDAVKTLEAAVPGAGNHPDAATLNSLGALYLSFGRPDQSAQTLRRALAIDSDLPEAYVNLGNALSRLGDQAGAIGALGNAIRLQPGSAAAHNNLASILHAKGDFGQAKYHFERAIHSDPDYAVAHYNFGRALAEKKLYAEAEAQLSAALRLDPQLAEAAVTLGMVLIQTGQLQPAIESYRQAIRIKPSLTAAHFNLGLALIAQGEKTEAKPHFELVIRSAPNDYEAHLHLGEILLGEGSYESAIINLQAASQSPRPRVRRAAQDALRTARSAR